MKVYWGSESIAPLIRCDQLHAPAALPPGKELPVPIG
jgi:hypothetical protein